jgi:site-specific DNA recombinase
VQEYGYYRCIGTEAYRFGGAPKCGNLPLQKKTLEEVVWQKVCELLEDSAQLEQEYYRRLGSLEPQLTQTRRTSLESQMNKARQGLGRLIDAYSEGLLDKSEFEPRLVGQRQRLRALEEELAQLVDVATLSSELRLIIGRLEEFAAKVKDGLLNAEWLTRREIMRALIKRVEVDQQQVNIVFKVPPVPKALTSGENLSQDCRQRVRIAFWKGGSRYPDGFLRYRIGQVRVK